MSDQDKQGAPIQPDPYDPTAEPIRSVRYQQGQAPVSWNRIPERPIQPAPAPPAHNPGMTFLGMSGGILALVIAGSILLFCVLPVVACFGAGILGAVTPTPTVSP